MKRRTQHIFVFIIGFCLLSLNAYAQPRLDHKEIYLGVQGGVLASMVSFSPEIEQNALQPFWGANGGLVFRYSEHKVCGIQLELNYMQRGWHEVATGYQRQIDYIQIPLLSHIAFGKKCRGFLNLGPQVGYAFRETEKLPSGIVMQGAQYAHIDNAFDWGIAGGLGVLYRTNKAGVYQLEARFNYSFGDIFSNHKTDYFGRSASMNLSLNFAWLWEFKQD